MAYDHSVINQAAGDIIINNGVSEEVVRTLLREKTVAAHQELSQQYPLGYALFGIANGNVVFQPEAGLEFNPKNKAVVEIDPTKNRVTVKLVFFQATFPNGSHPIIENDEHVFAYVENKPVPFGMQFGFGKNGEAINAYIEVLDKSKFIFLLGLKYVE